MRSKNNRHVPKLNPEISPLFVDGLITIDEAADLCGLCRASIYNLMARGELVSVKIGRSRRIPKAALIDEPKAVPLFADRLVTLAEASEFLRVSRATIYNLIAGGELISRTCRRPSFLSPLLFTFGEPA